ncbi:unnamed protein product [Alternaria alternata]
MPTPSLRQVIGIPNSTASVKDSVLVIIDAQDEYIYGSLPAQDYKQVNIAISSLLEKYREQNGHVVHVLHDTGSDEAPIFKSNGKLTKEMDGVEAIKGETIVWKKHAGSFSETNLAEIVKKTGLGNLFSRDTWHMVVYQRDMKDIPAGQVKKVALTEIDDMFGTVVKASDIN